MTSCAGGTSIGPGLTSDDFLKGTDSKEGVYTLSSLVYQLPDLTPWQDYHLCSYKYSIRCTV